MIIIENKRQEGEILLLLLIVQRSSDQIGRMPRVLSRTKTRNIDRDAIRGFVYVGSDLEVGI